MTIELMERPNGHIDDKNKIATDGDINKKVLKVAIIGTSPSSLRLAPYDDPGWEIWGLNTLHTFNIPRWDRWFDLHPVEWTKGVQNGSQWAWMQQDHGKPVYMQEPCKEVPNAQLFPIEKIKEQFGGYFTNTVSLMMAFAILEGAKEIGLFGVDMAQTEEYTAQRPSCEYFVGLARGMGIKVHIPAESQLLKTAGIYGYDMSGEVMAKLRAREAELNEKVANFERQRDTAESNRLIFAGALDNLQWTKQFFNPPGN